VITYRNKQLPDPDVGFPRVFIFGGVHIVDVESLPVLHLLRGTPVAYMNFHLPVSKAEFFTALSQIPVRGVGFYLPIEDTHLPRFPRTISLDLKFGTRSRVTAVALLRKTPHMTLNRFGGGGGIRMAKMGVLRRKLHFHILDICGANLSEDWTSFVPCPGIMFEGFNADMVRKGVEALRHSAYFRHRMEYFNFWGSSTERQLNDAMIELLLLSAEQRPAALRGLHFNAVHLSTELIARVRRAYPTVKVIHIPR